MVDKIINPLLLKKGTAESKKYCAGMRKAKKTKARKKATKRKR